MKLTSHRSRSHAIASRRAVRSLVLPLSMVALLSAPWAGCGSNDNKDACVVGTATGCENGQVCEQVVGAAPACFAPVEIQGRVFDPADDSGIADATVVALDVNGGARTTTVRTAADGTYALAISVPRDAEGNPQQEQVTLRVSALGYQTFPTAPRTALPIEIDKATLADKTLVVQNAATDVALYALAGGASGLGTISGHIDTGSLADEDGGGVLVVAEASGRALSTAVSDNAGEFVLFNVPAGSVDVGGYRKGLNVTAQSVDVAAGADVTGVVLAASADGLGTVTGQINFADAPGGSSTSVLLVLDSTYDETTRRGEAPAGLRVGNVTSAFSFEDVPPGRYVILAAFENDGLVRDPDESIGGTATVRVDVNGGTVDAGQSFKITGALDVVSPGADGIEVISQSNPTLTWRDDSSEDGYELRVFDAFGEKVHEDLNVPRVTGSQNVTYTLSGVTLAPAMIYQFRVVSWRDKKGGSGQRTYISATEDLRGVFQYVP